MGAKRHLVATIDRRLFEGSALTGSAEVPKHHSDAELGHGIPVTYVPARNTVFLSFALAWAATIFGALHQEDPADILAILRRAHAALKPGGKLYVLDMMTDASHAQPAFSALFAVNMALTTANGWVFSDSELKDLMTRAGFEPGETRPVPPPMPHWLVGAVKR